MRITEQKLSSKDKTLASILNSIAEGVVVADKDGHFLFFNPVAESILGLGAMDVDPSAWSELYGCYHTDEVTPYASEQLPLSRALRGEEVAEETVFIRNQERPEGRYVCISARPICHPDGPVIGGTAILRDITQQRKQQEQEGELNIARELQQRFYKTDVAVSGYDITGAAYPATETCGDYFDVMTMADGSVGLVVGDVSGHGLGAALIMVETRALLHAFIKEESDPCVLLNQLNKELVADLNDRQFVTMVLARLDPKRHVLDYASAGHVSAYLLDGAGEIKRVMNSTGIPLGISEAYDFCKSETIDLAPDDMVVLLSDGVEEARTCDKMEFGVDRILEVIRCRRHAPSHQIVENLYRTVCDFTKPQTQEDDITSIICKGEVTLP